MIIALLLAAAIAFFAGSSGGGDFALAKLDSVRDQVKKHVQDERRSADALAVLDGITAARETQLKERKTLGGELDEAFRSRTAKAEDLEKVFAKWDKATADAWDQALTDRENLKKNLTAAEWAAIFPAPPAAEKR